MKIFDNSPIVTQKRVLAFIVLALFIFCMLIGRLFFIQIIQGAFLQSKAVDQWTRDLPLKALRGDIKDSEGRILASSYTSYAVYARPRAISNKTEAAYLLAQTLDLSYESVLAKISRSVSEVTIAKQVPKAKADSLKLSGQEGLYMTEDSSRVYPYGEFLTQVLGYTNIDNIGQSGIESYYNDYLTGLDGIALTETDIGGIEIGKAGSYIPSVPGMTLTLTVDAEIQSYAETAVRDAHEKYQSKSASCIVVDTKTGGVVALASTPSFDLNAPPRDNVAMLNELSKNKMLIDVYEPGSTFKVFTTAAALELGLTNENERFYCPGYRIVDGQRIKCWKTIGHGSQTLAEGVKNSCNCVFMDLALRIGVERYYQFLDKFGFGQKTGVDYPAESKGIIMNKSSVKNVDLARIGFGQAIAVTPMQVMSGLSAAVNGGTSVATHFAQKATAVDLSAEVSFEKAAGKRVISESTSKLLSNMLELVVSEGSGKHAQVKGYKIGGKTGTAQKYANGIIAQGKYVSSFVGYAPVEDPRYALIFIVDEPTGYLYYGSLVAAPYAGKIFSSIFTYKNIPPTVTNDEEAFKLTIEMPSLVGLSFTDAASKLASLGLQYECAGESGTVVEQVPAPGVMLAKKSVTLIALG